MIQQLTNTYNSNQLEQLKLLVHVNADSSEGFLSAATIVEEPELQKLFRSCGISRSQFAKELQRVIATSGQNVNDDLNLCVVMYRWWLLLKNTLSTDSSFAILAEVERGENDVKQAYQDAIEYFVSTDIEKLIKLQFMHVKAVQDRVRRLRQFYSQV